MRLPPREEREERRRSCLKWQKRKHWCLDEEMWMLH